VRKNHETFTSDWIPTSKNFTS